MIELVIKGGKKIQYDDTTDTIYVNGVKDANKSWSPSYIPNGDDEPTFFGFVDKIHGICYDVYGHESKITDEDKIKL